MIAGALNQMDDLWAVVVDVGQVHDLDELCVGSLIAAAGIWLLEREQMKSKALRRLREFAYGTLETFGSVAKEAWSGLEIALGSAAHRGILRSPSTGRLAWQMADTLREAVLERVPGRTPVFLFDSLDRVLDPAGFRTVLEKDAAALVDLGFGVVLTAPVDTAWLHADELRASAKSWDTLPYEDPRKSPEAFVFLLEILRRRIIDETISDAIAQRLVHTSGGVLRDLIDLARNSVEEAYMSGHDVVTQADATASIARFARSLSLGLDAAAMATLRSVHETGTLERFDAATLRLLKNRQIIEHYAEDSYFEVHPVLQPAVERWAAAS